MGQAGLASRLYILTFIWKVRSQQENPDDPVNPVE
jgi:hypothetical protein